MRRFNARILVACFILTFSSLAFANIEVEPILVDVVGNAQPEDIRVSNLGNEIAYVKITPKLIENPGTDQEKLMTFDEPAQLGLLVSQTLMKISPHQSKLLRIRFLHKASPTTDTLYRIDVQPVVGDLVLPKKSNEIGIKILVGYGVIIIQRPEHPKPIINMERNGNTLVVKNTGNTNALLTNGKQCDTKNKNCQELPPKRIYAGQTWEYQLPYSTPVTYQESYLDNVKTLNAK